MKLSSGVQATRARFVAAFPVPSIQDHEEQQAYEERCRQWTIKHAEQQAFEHPDDGYAVKRGDSGRPICKDCLAQFKDGKLLAWDMLIGASGGHPQLAKDPDSIDLTGPPDGPQFFENRPQFFKPTNHLGTVVEPPKPPDQPPSGPGDPPKPPVPSDVESLLLFMATTLENLDADVRASLGRIEKKQNEPHPPVVVPAPHVIFPRFTGTVTQRFVGTGTIELEPEKPKEL